MLNVLDGVDDSIEHVSLALGESYDDAIEFHKAGTLVRASGELNREGRSWELTNVTDLALLTSNEIMPLELPVEGASIQQEPAIGAEQESDNEPDL
ncbi:hypothetical protein SAMN04488582_103446 [Mycobacterium sp. 455mf]|nr:hypothetical protein SAMN04488582_103446 [Mycobacterium sp. 455mf]